VQALPDGGPWDREHVRQLTVRVTPKNVDALGVVRCQASRTTKVVDRLVEQRSPCARRQRVLERMDKRKIDGVGDSRGWCRSLVELAHEGHRAGGVASFVEVTLREAVALAGEHVQRGEFRFAVAHRVVIAYEMVASGEFLGAPSVHDLVYPPTPVARR
jgi:hypothetical protein